MTTPFVGAENTGNGYGPGGLLYGLGRCPHCSVASPNMIRVWGDSVRSIADVGWTAFRCNTCSGVAVCFVVLQKPESHLRFNVLRMWPEAKAAHEDIPEPARTFLKQAYETLHAPDAAAVMAGSAVDGMLKAKGFREGSLYARIDQALEANVLTQGMADWAHSVRLGSNRPRHADEDRPHVTPDEAKQSVEFAEALGSFLFVLTAKIERGIEAAQAADQPVQG